MEPYLITVISLLFCVLAQTCYGAVLFSSLSQTLVISASPKPGQAVLNAGEDQITVSWGLNQSLETKTDELYKVVKVKLCYAPISQVDRKWRKTVDNLGKDKTCQFTIISTPYKNNQSFEWRIERDIPTATYFVRAYAYNSDGDEVAYGQTTDTKKSSNLFQIQGITGRHSSIDIASVCFSAFALVSVFGFFLIERRKNRRPAKN